MRAHHVALGALAVAGLGLGALWWRSTPPPASPPSAPAPTLAQGSAPAPTGEACRFTPGAVLAFDYRSETYYRLSTRMPGAAAPVSQPGRAELAGRLTFEVLSAAAEGAVLLGRLTGSNELARELSGPALENAFLARVDGRCEVQGFARFKDTPRPVSRAQHVLLSDLSFSVGDGTPVAEVLFNTSIGTLKTLVSRGPRGELQRKPLAYVARWSPRMEGVEVAEGLVSVDRGGAAWLEALHGVEEVAGGAVEFSRSEWDVKAVAADPAPLAGASRALADYRWENALAEVAAEGRVELSGQSEDHQRRVDAMQAVSWPVAMERFTALLEARANIDEQWRDMAAYLDAHPDQVDDFVEVVTAEDFPPGFKAPAFLALGQARTPVAREALLGVYRERGNGTADRVRSSLALVMRSDVGTSLAQELRAEATRPPDDEGEAAVSRQAYLHLGILSGTHAEQPGVLVESLAAVDQLAGAARTPEDYSVLFGLVGNMAERSLLPRIAQWTQLPDAQSRRHVPHALRRYKVELVEDLVVEWLGRETSPDVKRELFDVLHHMHVDAGRPVSEAILKHALRHLAEQPMVLTRQSLIHLLEPFIGTHPQVRAALKAQLRVEYDERSGLYSLLAQDLPQEDVAEMLAGIPKLSAQFGGTLRPAATPAAAPPPAVPLPDQPVPAAMEAAMQDAPRGEP